MAYLKKKSLKIFLKIRKSIRWSFLKIISLILKIIMGIREWLSLRIALKPRIFILNLIIGVNIILCLGGASAVVLLTKNASQKIGFWEAFYYSFSMIIDAGNIQNIIPNVTKTHLTIIILGIFIVLFGMVVFSGAIIGYISSSISSFIENASNGDKKIYLNNHIVILNWSNKVTEIINDLLYMNKKEKIIILVENYKDKIMDEIEERLSNTINKERGRGLLLNRNNLTIIVREGFSYSLKDLDDISIRNAKSVIIFGKNEYYNKNFEKILEDNNFLSNISKNNKNKIFDGDAITIKTLIQITKIINPEENQNKNSKNSLDKNIIIESKDSWTLKMTKHIIEKEEISNKNIIQTISSDYILGEILAQIWLMPELNLVYDELFSYNGAEFYSKEYDKKNDLIEEILDRNSKVIPLTTIKNKRTGKEEMFYVSRNYEDLKYKNRNSIKIKEEKEVEINYDYWVEPKKLLLIGDNSKVESLFKTLDNFSLEWKPKDNNQENILDVTIIKDSNGVKRSDPISKKQYVSKEVEIDIYDTKALYDTIEEFLKNSKNASILILSDDSLKIEEQDAFTITYLIYLKDILKKLERKKELNFNKNNIDIVVEVSNPKNYDIIKNYNIKNLVVSNSYISRIITQLINKNSLYEFYKEILEYDKEEGVYDSKEIYIKKVNRFFSKIPEEMTIGQLMKAVYKCSPIENKAILIGYIDRYKKMTIFANKNNYRGNRNKKIILEPEDKLIIFSNH